MIIHHRSWGCNNIYHKCKTVKEFIDSELMKIENKEKKYFRICTKNSYNGKQNMLLYFQDGKLKSHHSTQIAFDYNDVLDYEIYDLYSMDDLKVDNIVSVDDDCLEELQEKFKEEDDEFFKIDLETLGMSKEEKFKYSIDKMFEEDEIKKIVKSNAYVEDKIVVKALRMLFEETDEVRYLKNRVKKLEKTVERQSQQIKWLGKNKY